MVPRSVLRAAERAGGFGATACDSDVVAAAIAADSALSAARLDRSSEVSMRARLDAMCVRVAMCMAVVRLGAAAAAAAPSAPRALVAHDSPHPVCRARAGHSVAAALPQCHLSALRLLAARATG